VSATDQSAALVPIDEPSEALLIPPLDQGQNS
jgi:hypothetical protein